MISKKAKLGKGVRIGHYCYVEDDVEIGDGTIVKNYVEIRGGTKIGKNCYIDSGVKISGHCEIGDNVTLRYQTIIARGCIIGNDCYLSPRVMTNNLNTDGKKIGGAKIGRNTFVGSHTVLHHGIIIEPGTVIGSMSFVNKSIKNGRYAGIPVKELL